MHVLEAISPVDGRYRRHTQPLAEHLSEMALMRYRLRVECEYLMWLAEMSDVGMRSLTVVEKHQLSQIMSGFEVTHAEIIKAIETKGWQHFPKTNHDVKAVELYLRHQLSTTSMADCLEWIHFALTSEDVNNLSYAMMLDGAVTVLLQELRHILRWLDQWAIQYADLSMLARTHGQPASPTTLGKEMRVYAQRLKRQLAQLQQYQLLVKLNGATGNYNAHQAARPDVDWIQFTRNFVAYLNRRYRYRFEVNLYTTQIEPHDTYSELFDIVKRINVILVDFCQDMWRYISDDWIVQTAVAGETGSSTMPNKVNPIDFENAEGNAIVANALLECYGRTLPVSRLQRHLSDSTIIRTFGEALGHCQICYRSLQNGLSKIRPNEEVIVDVVDRPEVLAEAFQTILRAAGYPNAYDRLKELTRGRKVTEDDLIRFVHDLEVDDRVKAQLRSLTPQFYTGLATYLARGTEV